MKFMLVSDTFPPDINGVARTLQTLARGLAERGHAVSVVTTTERSREENAAHGVKVEAVAALPVPGYDGIRLGFTSRRYISERISQLKPDALYVAVETIMGCNAIRAARERGLRVVSGFHTNFHTYSRDYRLPLLKSMAMRYLKWVHNRTARTLTPSESTAEQLRALGIDNVGVLGRGVDTRLFHRDKRDAALRASWGAGDDTPVAMFVVRIAAEKNLPLAVRAFERITTLNPAARCVFVGDGPRAAWLREQYPGFVFAGARIGDDLARHYASADLFIFPSLSETFGNVLTEALASGLVTVSYDYAAAKQHVQHRENGFVATPEDEAGFLDAAREALEHWRDATLRDAAFATAQKLSWSSIVEQFERELVGARYLPAATAIT
jgi:glycosyltransferase involved in cell wall biosynthesis